MVHDVDHTCKSVNEQGVHSVPTAKFTNKNHAKQHSEECKVSPSHSYDMLHPSLAAQVKLSLEGNTNKTGSFDGNL